jgi:hypothetical protein
MDELAFRRHALAEPKSRDPEFLQAIAEAEGRDAFIKELQSLDVRLEQALRVQVPEGLAERLLLRQQLRAHQARKRNTGWLMAMAASVAFIAGISFTLLRLAPVDLADHALAHVYHEAKAMRAVEDISYHELNLQLASFKGLEQDRFTQQPGRVLYTAYCDFQGVRSLHLVMQGEKDKVTLFIVPFEKRMQLRERFADDYYQGLGFQTQEALMILVGEQASDLDEVKRHLQHSFI